MTYVQMTENADIEFGPIFFFQVNRYKKMSVPFYII